MFYKVDTPRGYIGMEKAVIGKIIVEVIDGLGGRAVISNKNGKVTGPIARIGGLEDKNHIEITMNDQKSMDIRIYVVIRFGSSISMVTETLIAEIKKQVEYHTDIEVNSVAVMVTGMISKNISKRNIEVRG